MAFLVDRAKHTGSLCVLMAALVLLTVPAIRSDSECPEKLLYESRDDIPLRFRWNPFDLFKDREAFDIAVSAIEAAIPELESRKGTLGDSADALIAGLRASYELQRMAEEVDIFGILQLETSASDPAVVELSGRASSVRGRVDEASAFVETEIAALPRSKLTAFMADPRTEPYRHVIDDLLRRKAHTRSHEVELVLAGAAPLLDGPLEIYQHLVVDEIEWPTVVDKEGEEVKAAPSTGNHLRRSLDRDFRREGHQALLTTFEAYGNTLSTALATYMQGQAWVTKVRRYNTTLERSLDVDSVPVQVLRSLVDTMHDNFAAVHNYTALRKEALGVETLYAYDMEVTMVPNGGKRYCFEEAWDLAMAFWNEVYGEEYAAVAKTALADRWLDVFNHEGRSHFGNVHYVYRHHSYLSLNWAGDFYDLLVMIHQMGHIIHANFTATHQPYQYSQIPLFLGEMVATISMNLFLDWAIQRSKDPQERAELLHEALDFTNSYFISSALSHEFEEAIYTEAENGGPLTKETMGDTYLDLNKAYYGPDLTLNASDGIFFLNTDHFYHESYFIYVYATGYVAAEAIASRLRNGDHGAVDDYLAMMKLGTSVYPMDAVRVAGVDLQDPAVIRGAMLRLQSLTEEFAIALKEAGKR